MHDFKNKALSLIQTDLLQLRLPVLSMLASPMEDKSAEHLELMEIEAPALLRQCSPESLAIKDPTSD